MIKIKSTVTEWSNKSVISNTHTHTTKKATTNPHAQASPTSKMTNIYTHKTHFARSGRHTDDEHTANGIEKIKRKLKSPHSPTLLSSAPLLSQPPPTHSNL